VTLKRTRRWIPIFIVILVSPLVLAQSAAQRCAQCEEWNRPQKPFRIFGNSYYVGPHGLSSVLITSGSGHVLIDGALPASAAQIEANIKALGFRLQDVKLIVNSHGHFDHAGGIAALQRLSGASVVASPWSASVLKHGGVGKDDPQYGAIRPVATVKNPRGLRDGQSFHVGEIVITAHLTPGHTPGGTSWTWQSCEDKVCRNMVYADSLNPVSARGFRFSHAATYPTVLEDFQRSFAFFENVPCDIATTSSSLSRTGQKRKVPSISHRPGAPCARCWRCGKESVTIAPQRSTIERHLKARSGCGSTASLRIIRDPSPDPYQTRPSGFSCWQRTASRECS